MTIESSPPATTAASTPSGSSTPSGRSAAGAGGPGFGSILQALGTEGAEGAGAAAAPAASSATVLALASATATAAAGSAKTAATTKQAPDPATDAASAAAAALLVQNLNLGLTPGASLIPGAPVQASGAPDAQAAGVGALARPGDGVRSAQARALLGLPGGTRESTALQKPELPVDAAAAGGKGAKGSALSTKELQGAPAVAGASSSPASSGNAAPAQAHGAGALAPAEMDKVLQTVRALATPIAAQQSASEKPASGQGASGVSASDASYSAQPLGVSSPGFAAGADAPASPAADTTASAGEQVKYWISQDVQNAEMKLDGLGKQPVEVSISMSGNAAHIAFRSDEAQALGALQSAGAQLKDMLQREGLVLSGVSVGMSGSNGNSSGFAGGDGQPRQTGTRSGTTTVVPASASTSARVQSGSASAVDLFV